MWKQPSARVCELMRRGAKILADLPQDRFDELDTATLEPEYMQVIADDPVFAESIRRSIRSNLLHWAAANIGHPGEPVLANTSELLAIARDVFRRGLDGTGSVDAYRRGQNAVWQIWMQIVFELTTDLNEQRELLEVSARSFAVFIDATLTEIYRQIQIEREVLTGGTDAERRQIVALILDGATVPQEHAEKLLGYQLSQHHTAAVIWGDESDTKLADLDRIAGVLMRVVDGRRSLSLPVSAATRWVWIPGVDGPDLASVSAAISELPGVRIALGPTAAGIEGFRRSHIDAVTTQRMMARFGPARRVARFADIELMALIIGDSEKADRFIKRTLGDFESADAELQRTVLTFVHEQCNAARAAERLFTHRNTLVRRIARANELLPQPLEKNSVQVAVALEALRWR